MGESLPPPTNKLIDVAKIVIDQLIEHGGVDLAVAAAVAAEPVLANPLANYFLRWAVGLIAQVIDDNLYKYAITAIIQIQSAEFKDEFNLAIEPIILGSPTDAEIQLARDAADHIIERNR